MTSTGCLSYANSVVISNPSTSKASFQNSSMHKYCAALNPKSKLRSSIVYDAADSNPITKPNSIFSSGYYGTDLLKTHSKQRLKEKCKASTIAIPAVEEVKELSLPSWAEFELGRAPVFWKTMNGLPPTSDESLTLFYNPAARNLVPMRNLAFHLMGVLTSPSCVVVSQG